MKFEAEEIKKLLDEYDLSIVEVAHEAGLHPQTVYKALGAGSLRPRSISKITKAVNRLAKRDVSRAKAVS